MSIAIPDFWKLLIESRLLTAEQCQRLGTEFGRIKGAAAQGNALALAEWMVAQNVLTRFQADVLLAGQPGPFWFSQYRAMQRFHSAGLPGALRAVHAATNHPVVLHFLSGPAAQNQQLWIEVVKRAQRHVAVEHPQLVRCHELVDISQFKFLALEDPPGQPLEPLLAQVGKLPAPEACRWAWQLAQALGSLHAANLVHGDVRPASVWIDPKGNARLLRDPLHHPQPLPPLGHPAWNAVAARADYAAPELARPQSLPDASADLYALGCLLYRLIAGQEPFAGGDPASKIQRHAAAAIAPLESVPGAPQGITQLVAYLMAKNPAVRFPNAQVAAEQLARFIDPARLTLSQLEGPPSWPGYHAYLEQKRQQRAAAQGNQGHVAAAMAPVATPSAPAIGPIITTGPVASGKPSGAPAAAAGPKATSAASGGSSTTERLHGRKRGSSKQTQTLVAVGVAAGLLLIVGIFVINGLSGGGDGSDPATNGKGGEIAASTQNDSSTNGGRGTPSQSDNPAAPSQNQGGSATGQPAATPVKFMAVADDGERLWMPPTAGAPISLELVPPDAQFYLIARPKEMLAQDEGARLLDALGPDFAAMRAAWEGAAGVKLEEVERLIVALHPEATKMPRVSFVVTLAEPRDLPALWGNPAAKNEGDWNTYNVRGWSMVPSLAEPGRKFAMGAEQDMQEVVAAEGAAPLLRRDLEKLRAASDADRHATILFAPNFLFADGLPLFRGAREKMIDPLHWFIGDGIQAGSLSVHLSEPAYAEVRLVGTIDRRPLEHAEAFKTRLQLVPRMAREYIGGSIRLEPYWQRLAIQYPQMIAFLHDQTRVGVQDDYAVLNAYVPQVAMHNIALASELAIASSPAGPATVAANPQQPANQAPATVADALKKRVTVQFPAESLEFAIRDLAAEIGVPIKIEGQHLQLEGITRNQQIREFDMVDKTVEEVLLAMVMKANPVTTVKEPTEEDQKLVYVIAPDAPGQPDMIRVTTRKSAEAEGWKLPEVFAAK